MRILSLFDESGIMVRPWVTAGIECTIVDTQHPPGITEGNPRKIGADLMTWEPDQHYDAVFAFVPCTLLCRPASWHWAKHGGREATIQKGMVLVNRTRELIEKINPVFWMIENPTGQIPTQWRKYDTKFHPGEFGGWLAAPGEAYTKETCLWFSPNFPTLERREAPKPWMKHDPWIQVQKKIGNPEFQARGNKARAAQRSKTPSGFSYAVFNALFLELAAQVGGTLPRRSTTALSTIGQSASSLLLEKLKRARSSEDKAFLWDQIREAVLYGEISGEDYYQALQTRNEVAENALCLPSAASSVAGRPIHKTRTPVSGIQLWQGGGLAQLPSVGAKPKWNDPSQKPEDLVKLAKRNPKVYSNPNLPFEALLEGAKTVPWLVEQNSVLGLLQLEDPARYVALQKAIDLGWLDEGIEKLHKNHQRAFAIDCAERCLFHVNDELWEARAAIDASKAFLKGKIDEVELSKARALAFNLASKIETDRKLGHGSTSYAVHSAESTANPRSDVAAIDGSKFSLKSIKWGGPGRMDLAEEKEVRWQTDRIRFYYAKEHPEYKLPEFVGAKPKPKFNNPMLPMKDLDAHAKKVPKTYTNPNVSFDALLIGAQKWPWYVEQNPALVMFQLENPAQFRELKVSLAEGWLLRKDLLSASAQRLYAADCAEHVSPIFYREYPEDLRPQKAIEVARLYARGMATNDELLKGAADASYAARIANRGHLLGDLRYASAAAALAAVSCANSSSPGGAGHHGREAALLLVKETRERGNDPKIRAKLMVDAEDDEKLWQADRVRYYYAQEHPEYTLPQVVGRRRKGKKS